MTRLDVKQKRLGDFLDWSLTTISQTNEDSVTDRLVLDGALQSLVNKHMLTKRTRAHGVLCTCTYANMHVCVSVHSCICACLFETIVIYA